MLLIPQGMVWWGTEHLLSLDEACGLTPGDNEEGFQQICNPLWQKKQIHKVVTQLPVSFLHLFLFFWCLRVTPYLLSYTVWYSIAFSCLGPSTSACPDRTYTFHIVVWSLHVYKHLAWCCWQCFAQSFDLSSPIILCLLLTSIRRLWCSSMPLYVSEMNDLSVSFVVECHFCCRMKDTVSNNYNFTTAI